MQSDSSLSAGLTKFVKKLQLQAGVGIVGEVHLGPRFVDAREELLREVVGMRKGAEPISNIRQLTVVSRDELDLGFADMGINEQGISQTPAGLLGENIVFDQAVTWLPRGTLVVIY